jgi:hypothetical protein
VLPNFFVIGAAKCGTTSLAYYLERHPQVHMSSIKETRFFAAPDSRRPFGGPRVERLSDYEALFESAASARGEASPAYSQHPWRPGVPERIRKLIPEARFVYLVGDPVRRFVSHYRQAVAQTGETQSLTQIVEHSSAPEHPFLCAGRYTLQIERYLGVFPRERLLVVDQDELLHERRSALGKIFAFLDVSPDYWDEEFELVRNRGSEHRRISSGFYGRMRGSALRTAVGALPAPARENLVKSVRRAIARPVEEVAIDASLRRRLETRYRPEVARLRELTGQGFERWSL